MTDERLDADLDRLRAAHARIDPPNPPTVAAARHRLLEATRTTRARPHRRMRWRPLLATSGGLAVAAVAVVALLPSGASDRLGRATPLGVQLASAAQRECAAPADGAQQSSSCLTALGAVAGDWSPPGTGDVLYQRSWWSTSIRYLDGDGRPTARPDGPGVWGIARGAEQETWIAPDGSGETLQAGEGEAYLPSDADRAAWKAAGEPPLDKGAAGPVTGSDLTSTDGGRRVWGPGKAADALLGIGETTGLLRGDDPLVAFSTDPTTLRSQVLDFAWRQRIELAGEPSCAKDLHDCSTATRRNVESAFGTVAVGVLAFPSTTKELRSAILRMLAEERGFETAGTTTDPRGRRGVAVLLPPGTNDGKDVLLIDVASARPIAQGMSRDRSLRTTRWTAMLNLEVSRVAEVGAQP